MKLSGVEFKRYYQDPEFWPEGLWHDDEEITVDGVAPEPGADLLAIPDTCVIDVKGGVLLLEKGESRFAGIAMDSHMRAWQRKQTVRNLLVEVDESKLEAVVAAIKAAGGRVAA
jgi:hypothetical protein